MFGEFVEIPQGRLPAEARFQFPVHRVAEDEPAETIAAVMRRPGQQCGRTARIDRLEAPAGCEMHVGSQVDHDQHGALALLPEKLGVRGRAARGHAPVDGARVVTGLIGPRFIELHAAATKVRNIRAGLQGPDPEHVERYRTGGTAQANEAGLRHADG